MSKPKRGGRPKGLPKAPTRRSATPGRAPSGRGRSAPGAPRGKVGGGGASRRRAGVGGDQVEGRHAVRELLLVGRRRIREIWVLADAEPSPVLDDILELARSERVTVREVGRGRFFAEARCEAPQGVLAKADAIPETPLEELTRPRGEVAPFLLAVDGVTDPGNLGALLRSAECAGVTGVVLPRHRAVHVTPTVTKAAAGAIEYLPMALVGGLPNAIATMRDRDVWVVGLDAGGDTSVHDLDLSGAGVCLVLGAEGRGLSRLVRERCDLLAAIPLHGRLASLNVAAAGAIACYEIARRRAG